MKSILEIINLLKNIIFKIRHDKALIASGINQFWRFISGPVNMLLIAHFLTAETQGYWYSFISICAMSVFADLGFTAILLQFAAHEKKALKIQNKTLIISGIDDELAAKKLGSLFMFSTKWISITVVTVYPAIFLIGSFLYASKHSDIGWQLPWLIYVVFSAISFFCLSLLSFIEGCDQVANVQMIKFVFNIISSATMAITLLLHLNLTALAVSTLLSSSTLLLIVLFKYSGLFKQLRLATKNYYYNWKKDVFRLLWKYAITFTSGYLVFQIYTPLAFSRFGAEYAGKIGLTMTIMTAAFSISNIWLTSRSPQLNALTAAKDWKSLDALFKNRFLSGFSVLIAGLGCFYGTFILLENKIAFLGRVLPLIPLVMIGLAWVFQYIINGLAMYMRLHKEEPIVGISIIAAVFTTVSTLLLAYYFDRNWMFAGFLCSQIIFFPFIYKIYIHYKTVRHAN